MVHPVRLIASLWVRDGRTDAFHAYEFKAAALMQRYDGFIERVESGASGPATGEPFEIHHIRFPSQASLDAYRNDPDLQALAGEREACIARTTVVTLPNESA